MTGLSTHVLDLAHGLPVAGMTVRLDHRGDQGGWEPLAAAATDADGRISRWPGVAEIAAGTYRLTFLTGPHLDVEDEDAFYPEIIVIVRLTDAARHHHVPLLLSPFGYTTYRGS
jgi:5-hydroxyisourate hydrolase